MPKLSRKTKPAGRSKIRRIRAALLGSHESLALMPEALAWLQDLQTLEANIATSQLGLTDFVDRLGLQNSTAVTREIGMYRPIPRRIMVGNVAVLPIIGFMESKPSYITHYGFGVSTERIEEELQACGRDNLVSDVVLYCDSPGGNAMGNEELANTITKLLKSKSISAFVRGLCCSACYYVASATKKIVATPSSLIGSIGTMTVHSDYSKYLSELGIKPTIITFGENKAIGNPYEPLSAKARGQIQEMINSMGKQFVDCVARGRNVSPETVMSNFGQGRVFLAEEARSRGMVDRVANWEQFAAELPGTTSSTVEDRHVLDKTPTPTESSTDDGAQSPGQSAGAATPKPQTTEESVMWNRIKAALYAAGLIASMDVSDEVVKATAAGIFAGRGIAMPTDEAQILSGVQASVSPPAAGQAAAAAVTTGAAPIAGATANVTDAHNREQGEARAEAAVTAERTRSADIRARGFMMGISQQQIDAACNEGISVEAALVRWTDAQSSANRGVSPPTRVNVLGNGTQAMETDLVNAICHRLNRPVPAAQLNDHVIRASRAPLFVHALELLRAQNISVVNEHDREEIVHAALEADGRRQTIRSESGGAVNRPGSLPAILGGVWTRVLDDAMLLARPSYTQWAGRWGNELTDFRTTRIVAKGYYDQFDELGDAEDLKDQELKDEVVSDLMVGRYGNTFTWTPVMIANDDLNALQEAGIGFGIADQNTLNRLCLNILLSNMQLLNGNNLFSVANGNDITGGSGGKPSDTQWEIMDNAAAEQKGIGGKGYLRGGLDLCLIPPQLKRPARQTFMKDEAKVANVDTNKNVYAGDVDIVIEPELQAASKLMWYGMQKPIGTVNATVIYAYFAGFGAGGRRERWYDNRNKCFMTSFESRYGAAAKSHRYAQRNPGQ